MIACTSISMNRQIPREQIERFNFIDWMKTIGMYCIILGHFLSIGHKYIYVFSVPLFFVISGFLNKKADVNTFSCKYLLQSITTNGANRSFNYILKRDFREAGYYVSNHWI